MFVGLIFLFGGEGKVRTMIEPGNVDEVYYPISASVIFFIFNWK